MGRQLFARYPVFRQTVLELDDVYHRVVGISLIDSTGLFSTPATEPPIELPKLGWPVAITCPALAMLHIALFDLLQSLGIRPDCMIGHSAGETPILYASGAGSKAMAVEVAIARGLAMTSTETLSAGMAALGCNAENAQSVIERAKKGYDEGLLSISCYNAPESVSISGSNELLDRAVSIAKEDGLFAARIRTFVPGHCAYMHNCEENYRGRMREIFSRYDGDFVPKIPAYSTCSGDITVKQFNADYYWKNCLNPVQFNSGIGSILESQKLSSRQVVFLEISPHAVLASSILAKGVDPNFVLCPMKRSSPTKPIDETAQLLETVGKLSLLGVNSLDLAAVCGPVDYAFRPWLNYPLVSRKVQPHKRFEASAAQTVQAPILSPIFKHPRTTCADLVNHAVLGEPIMPMTGFIELVSYSYI